MAEEGSHDEHEWLYHPVTWRHGSCLDMGWIPITTIQHVTLCLFSSASFRSASREQQQLMVVGKCSPLAQTNVSQLNTEVPQSPFNMLLQKVPVKIMAPESCDLTLWCYLWTNIGVFGDIVIDIQLTVRSNALFTSDKIKMSFTGKGKVDWGSSVYQTCMTHLGAPSEKWRIKSSKMLFMILLVMLLPSCFLQLSERFQPLFGWMNQDSAASQTGACRVGYEFVTAFVRLHSFRHESTQWFTHLAPCLN